MVRVHPTLFQETWVRSMEESMAIHYSILAQRIPWTEKSGRLHLMGSHRVRHDWVTNTHTHTGGFSGGTGGKELACQLELCSIPGSGRSPGVANGNLLQYSCLENPMARGAWQAIVHRVTNGRTRLKRQHVQGDLDISLLIQPFYLVTAGLPFYFQVQIVNPSHCICPSHSS